METAPLSFGPSRAKAIARSLAKSPDRFALVEGDPGSGKTTLLREVAVRISARAATSWKADAPVGLYFNLKMLERSGGRNIDPPPIRQFIFDQIKRFGSPEIERFLDQHFDQGVREGWWFFLFDSFDEIPDVLGSEDTSDVVDRYSEAISGFATDFNRCRTLLATRYFRRPRDSSQPRFRVLPLSDKQRNQLIERAGLSPEGADRLYSGIATSGPSIRQICENPMYLGLLVEYVRDGADVPSHTHELFARFVDKAFDKQQVLLRRFELDAAALRAFAELAAFQIVADSRLGLNPKRQALLGALRQIDPDWQSPDSLLDLLEELSFARGEPDADYQERRFTFSHRRFQEYFATCYAMRMPESVSGKELLSDARWRETATVLLGSPDGQRIAPILALAQELLGDSLSAIRKNCQYQESNAESDPDLAAPDFFIWPPGSLHVLSILQDGFADNPSRLLPAIRSQIGDLVRSAFRRGRLEDRRIALEIAGPLSEEELTPLLRAAVSFGSRVLDDIAFRQIRNLQAIPKDLSFWIRITLLQRAARGRLVRDKRTVVAFLCSIPDGGLLLSAAKLLSRIGLIDDILHVIVGVASMAVTSIDLDSRAILAACILLSPLFRRLLWRGEDWLLTRIKASRIHPRLDLRPRWARCIQSRPPSWDGQLRFVCYFTLAYMLGMRWFAVPLIVSDDLTARNIYLAAGWMFVSAWAPMATAAVVESKFTSPRWWPLLTFYPLLRLIAEPVA